MCVFVLWCVAYVSIYWRPKVAVQISKAGFVPMQPDLWEVLQRMSIKPQAAKLLWITAKISRKEHIIIVIRYNNSNNT